MIKIMISCFPTPPTSNDINFINDDEKKTKDILTIDKINDDIPSSDKNSIDEKIKKTDMIDVIIDQ